MVAYSKIAFGQLEHVSVEPGDQETIDLLTQQGYKPTLEMLKELYGLDLVEMIRKVKEDAKSE